MLTLANRAEFLQQPSEVALVVRLPWDNGSLWDDVRASCEVYNILRPNNVRHERLLYYHLHLNRCRMSATDSKSYVWYDHGLTGYVGRVFIMLVSLVWLSLLRWIRICFLLGFIRNRQINAQTCSALRNCMRRFDKQKTSLRFLTDVSRLSCNL